MYFDAPLAFLVSPAGRTARTAALLLACWAAAPARGQEAAPAYALVPQAAAGRLTSVRVQLRVSGQLKVNPTGKEVKELPLELTAQHQYDERLLAAAAAPSPAARAARYYHAAEAHVAAAGVVTKNSLREERRLIVSDAGESGITLFSPLGSLEREELDLVEVPGNSALVDALLPGREVRVGDTWTPPEQALAGLLNVDAVSLNEVSCKLAEVTGGIAKVEMTGRLSAAVGGVASELELAARYGADVAAGRVAWLALTVKESRNIGHASPGLEVTAQLQMVVAPLAESKFLSDAALQGLTLRAVAGMTLLDFRSPPGSYVLAHDRRWHVLSDQGQTTILRLVDQGELLAQCNVVQLADETPDKQISLADYRAKIEAALGTSFNRVVDASAHAGEAGLTILRVVAVGTVNELPIQWTYYLLSDRQGRRVSIIFTQEPKAAERVSGADQALVYTFRFTERPAPQVAAPQAPQQPGTAAAGGPAKR